VTTGLLVCKISGLVTFTCSAYENTKSQTPVWPSNEHWYPTDQR